MKRVFFLMALFASSLIVTSCKDKIERVPCDGTVQTWDGGVIDIVADGCWGSNCHGAGASAGDFTTYNGIKPVLTNGAFEATVLIDRTMPQGGVLADSLLAKLECWFEQGFPEK